MILDPVIFKIPNFGEVYDVDLLETGKEFYSAELIPLPYEHIEMRIKYPVPELDNLAVDIKLVIKESKEDDRTRHDVEIYMIHPKTGNLTKPQPDKTFYPDSDFIDHTVIAGNEFTDAWNKLEGRDTSAMWLGELMLMCLMAIHLPQYEHVEVEISEKLNKRRAKRGKAPLKDYIMIQMRPEYRKALGGEGKAKTPHWRRGHIRTLGDGRKVPVKPCMVNFNGEPIEPKEYRMKA